MLLVLAVGAVMAILLLKRLGLRGLITGITIVVGTCFALGLIAFLWLSQARRASSDSQVMVVSARQGQAWVGLSKAPRSGCTDQVINIETTAEGETTLVVLGESASVQGALPPVRVKEPVPGPACEPPEYLQARNRARTGSAEVAGPPPSPTERRSSMGRVPAPARAPRDAAWLSPMLPLPWSVISAVALAAMIYLGYLFLDAGTRGQFTWLLRLFAVVAFATICGALLLAGRGL